LNFAPRVLLLVVLVATGFMLPFLWLGAAWVAFTLYADSRPAKVSKKDGRFPITTVEDPEWRTKAEECVESPAEEAFLSLMIEHFDLKPHDRALHGNGLTLRMQVETLRYRFDFLVDDALVVEIDGAQWHTSPEAVARDKKRDKELADVGYTILRIPAKIALYNRAKAVDLVKGMRAQAAEARKRYNNTRQGDLRHALKPTTIIQTAAEQTTKAAKFMDEMSTSISRRLAEQQAREVDPAQIGAVMDEVPAVIEKINIQAGVLHSSPMANSQDYARSIDASLQSILDPSKAPATLSAALGQVASLKTVLDHAEEMVKLDAEIISNPGLREIYEMDHVWAQMNTKKA